MPKFETILYERTEQAPARSEAQPSGGSAAGLAPAITDPGRIIRVTLNRPDKRNSLTTQMLEELCLAFDEAEKEKDACCIVLRGAGDKAFCAGADLGGMGGEDSGMLVSYDARGLFPKLFGKMLKSSKVTLAAVNGACVAGGLGLMVACDLAIAKAGVKLGTPEIARGQIGRA